MLRVFEPNLGPQEAEAAWRQVMSRKVSPGEKVAEFEAMLCAETGAKHAICCNSGTTALWLILHEDAWFCSSKNPHINVPSYGFQAAANAAALNGREVRTLPVNQQTLCVDDVPDHGTTVVISHNGNAAARDAIATRQTPGRGNLHDAATSLGLFKLLEWDTAIVSFSAPKVVTTGQGGVVLTNSDWIAKSIRGLCDHGGGNWRKTRIHEAIGGNFRMSDLNAAVGCVQMKRLPELLAIRHQRFEWYREHFPTMPDGWCAIVRCEKPDESIARLAEAGYEALRPYRPVQESVPFRDNPVDPVAVAAANECLYLPVHHLVQESDVDRICSIIKDAGPCKSIG